MPSLLGQLVYTSFVNVGFKLLASNHVPAAIQHIFVQEVVYQYWDAYQPPTPGYRAAYLRQIAPAQTLFGWLYHDGLDDLGRGSVPYFVCYYLAEPLTPERLDTIWAVLQKGPITLLNRTQCSIPPGSGVSLHLGSYRPAREGVVIPVSVRRQAALTLAWKKSLNLLIPVAEEPDLITVLEESLCELHQGGFATSSAYRVESLKGGAIQTAVTGVRSSAVAPNAELSLVRSLGVEDYRYLLLNQIRANVPQQRERWLKNYQPHLGSVLKIGLSLSAVLVFGIQVFGMQAVLTRLRLLTTRIQPTSNSIQSKAATQSAATQSATALRLTKVLLGHGDAVWSVAVSVDGKMLVSGSADRTIKIWNLTTGTLVKTLAGHSDVVRAIALSSDSQMLVSGSGDGTLKIWNLQTGTLIRTLTDASGPIWSIALSRDGQTLVSGSGNHTVQIWNLQTGQRIRTITEHSGRVFSVTLSPDDQTLATASLDRTVKLWDLQTGQLMRVIATHRDAVRAVAFSPDGQTLASASWDRTIQLWNPQTGQRLRILKGHTARVVTIAFSADGQTLYSGSLDHTLKIWSVQTGQLLQTLAESVDQGHADWVLAIATSRQQRLVSGSKDKTIRIWQP